MQQIEISRLPEQLPALLATVSQGAEIILTQDEQPIAKLIPYRPARRRKAGSAAGQIVMSPDFDEPLEDFRDYQPE